MRPLHMNLGPIAPQPQLLPASTSWVRVGLCPKGALCGTSHLRYLWYP